MNDARKYVSHVSEQGVKNTVGEERKTRVRGDCLFASYKPQGGFL